MGIGNIIFYKKLKQGCLMVKSPCCSRSVLSIDTAAHSRLEPQFPGDQCCPLASAAPACTQDIVTQAQTFYPLSALHLENESFLIKWVIKSCLHLFKPINLFSARLPFTAFSYQCYSSFRGLVWASSMERKPVQCLSTALRKSYAWSWVLCG